MMQSDSGAPVAHSHRRVRTAGDRPSGHPDRADPRASRASLATQAPSGLANSQSAIFCTLFGKLLRVTPRLPAVIVRGLSFVIFIKAGMTQQAR